MNRRRQNKERKAENEALAPAVAEPVCQLPPWLEEALRQNTATPVVEPTPSPKVQRRRDGYTKPRPVADQLRALLEGDPNLSLTELMERSGCSAAYAQRLRRQVREERGA